MAQFDVRIDEDIDTIHFAEHESYESDCNSLYLSDNGKVYIFNQGIDYDEGLIINSQQDAENMIKAIRKAIELKWFDK